MSSYPEALPLDQLAKNAEERRALMSLENCVGLPRES
jgi:hypothetical protein